MRTKQVFKVVGYYSAELGKTYSTKSNRTRAERKLFNKKLGQLKNKFQVS